MEGTTRELLVPGKRVGIAGRSIDVKVTVCIEVCQSHVVGVGNGEGHVDGWAECGISEVDSPGQGDRAAGCHDQIGHVVVVDVTHAEIDGDHQPWVVDNESSRGGGEKRRRGGSRRRGEKRVFPPGNGVCAWVSREDVEVVVGINVDNNQSSGGGAYGGERGGDKGSFPVRVVVPPDGVSFDGACDQINVTVEIEIACRQGACVGERVERDGRGEERDRGVEVEVAVVAEPEDLSGKVVGGHEVQIAIGVGVKGEDVEAPGQVVGVDDRAQREPALSICVGVPSDLA